MEEKRFSGVMNLDDPDTLILPSQHKDARNVRFYGTEQGFIAENIVGNIEVSFTKPAGTNQCIGAHYDQIKRRIYFFNYNSNGRHGIYYYDMRTGVVTKLFLCFTDSATDILSFSLNSPVHSCAIVYRQTSEGDLLYWTDGTNRPRYLNVDTVATLAPFTEVMINVAKQPPLDAPSAVYTTDSSYDANRVKNKYFQFAYRWVYDNFEKSTFSPWSEVAIPPNIIFPNQDIITNTNNAISVTVVSPSTEDFRSIEIIAREWLGAAWSDGYLVNTVSDADIATPLPWSFGFNFFNNGTYVAIPTDDTDLYYDHTPDTANTLELLNGNVLIYAGITDGYDQLERADVDVQITTSRVNSTSYPAVSSTWKWNQYYRFGIQYYDKYGKPIGGVVSFLADASIDSTNFDVTTDQYAGEINGSSYLVPKIFTTINHIPPQDAESYQWVRQDLVPQFFLQWVTNDYQTDAEYSYLCIQSLIEANTKNGFLPSYEYSSGDRVRMLGAYSSTENATAYASQPDAQILEVVQRVMANGNPASDGAFIKIRKPSTLPGNINQVIEIYTPPSNIGGASSFFYEWGERYGFQTIGGIKYHLGGTQNQTASLPALTEFTNGDVYLKSRQIYPTIDAVTYTLMLMDRRYNDFQQSAANSNGRAWLIDTNAKEEYNPVLVRWGGKYQPGTNINNINRFRPADFDEADRGKGDIRRLKARDRILRVFQDRGVGQYGIYARFIQNNEGVPELVTTNEIITTNNIQYYQGQYGLGGYPTSLVSSSNADYFADPVRGDQIRLSVAEGMTVISQLYKGQYTIRGYLTPYNRNLLRSDGSKAKIMGFFDFLEEQYHCILQAGTDGVETTTAKNFSFNEPRNGYASFYDYNPEWTIGAEDITFSFLNGSLYIHNNTNDYCTFYGVIYPAYVTVVFNKNLLQKKSWMSITEVANTTWICPTIYTNSYSYNTQRQESSLIAEDFTVFEGQPSASFLRDVNSIDGIINGDTLKGSLIVIKFQVSSPTDLVNLSSVSVTSIDSPLTSK